MMAPTLFGCFYRKIRAIRLSSALSAEREPWKTEKPWSSVPVREHWTAGIVSATLTQRKHCRVHLRYVHQIGIHTTTKGK